MAATLRQIDELEVAYNESRDLYHIASEAFHSTFGQPEASRDEVRAANDVASSAFSTALFVWEDAQREYVEANDPAAALILAEMDAHHDAGATYAYFAIRDVVRESLARLVRSADLGDDEERPSDAARLDYHTALADGRHATALRLACDNARALEQHHGICDWRVFGWISENTTHARFALARAFKMPRLWPAHMQRALY